VHLAATLVGRVLVIQTPERSIASNERKVQAAQRIILLAVPHQKQLVVVGCTVLELQGRGFEDYGRLQCNRRQACLAGEADPARTTAGG